MPNTLDQIQELEEQLRQAELGPDPDFFERILALDVILLSEQGKRIARAKVIDAHRPGAGPKFTKVEMKK